MLSKALLMAAAAVAPLVLLAGNASAANSNFARDRNTAVTERTPTGYEQLGIHAGAFTVLPSVELGLEGNDNIYYAKLGKAHDTIFSVSPNVIARSNWSRHQLQFSAGADIDNFQKHDSENTTAWNAGVGGRLDIHGNSYAFGGLAVSKNFEPRSSPSAPLGAAKPVQFDATMGNAGFVAEGNRLRFTGRVNYSKFDYDDVAKNDKTAVPAFIDEQNRDRTSWVYTGRFDYAVSPDTSVYAIYAGNKRDYRIQNTATSRPNSHGYDAGVGASFDLTDLLRGEVQVGYLEQTYKPVLATTYKSVKGVSYHGRLLYFPTQITTITAVADRSVEETPSPTASGYLQTAGSLSVDHELLRNAVISAGLTQTDDKYNGTDRRDTISTISLGGKYLVSRNVAVKGGYVFSKFSSKGATAIPGYKDNSFRLSLGL